MPYYTRKIRGKNCYKVLKKTTNDIKRKTKKNTSRKVFSKCTTLEKAKKQINLLRAIQYNKSFVPQGRQR